MSTGEDITRVGKLNVNLFMLPFAGGSFYSYRSIENELSPGIRAETLDLPGHGRRVNRPLLTDIRSMADDVFHRIKDRLEEPYALFGHSMGATLGYLTARRIADQGLPAPLHLFCTGRQAPTVPSREKGIHALPHDLFMEKLRAYDGVPEALWKEKELLDFFEPILRADFEAIGSYCHTPGPPLSLPVTVIIGSEDRATFEEACRWQEVTTRPVTVRRFPGRHFFIFRHARALARIIEGKLLTEKKKGPARAGSPDRNRMRRSVGYA